MAAIKGRDTKPEMVLRSALHRAGYRFRLKTTLPGNPDLAFQKHRATIFVHGCFWHMHNCPRFKQPGGENADFWREKLKRNVARDKEVLTQILSHGWRHFVVWECALVGKSRLDLPQVVRTIGDWFTSGEETGEIAGEFG